MHHLQGLADVILHSLHTESPQLGYLPESLALHTAQLEYFACGTRHLGERSVNKRAHFIGVYVGRVAGFESGNARVEIPLVILLHVVRVGIAHDNVPQVVQTAVAHDGEDVGRDVGIGQNDDSLKTDAGL